MTPTPAGLLAQAGPIREAGASIAGLGAQLTAALLGIAVAWFTIPLYWRLLKAMFKDPTPEKLAGVVIPALLAIALVGAAEGLADWAYALGQGFVLGDAG